MNHSGLTISNKTSPAKKYPTFLFSLLPPVYSCSTGKDSAAASSCSISRQFSGYGNDINAAKLSFWQHGDFYISLPSPSRHHNCIASDFPVLPRHLGISCFWLEIDPPTNITSVSHLMFQNLSKQGWKHSIISEGFDHGPSKNQNAKPLFQSNPPTIISNCPWGKFLQSKYHCANTNRRTLA